MLFYALHPKDKQLISLFEYEKKYYFQIKQGKYPHLLCPSCGVKITYCRKSRDGKTSHFRAIGGHKPNCVYNSGRQKSVRKTTFFVLKKRKRFSFKPIRITVKLKGIRSNGIVKEKNDNFEKSSPGRLDTPSKKSVTRTYILSPPKAKKHKAITSFSSLIRSLIENPEALTQWGTPLWHLFKDSKRAGQKDLGQTRLYFLRIKNFQQIIIKKNYAFINNLHVEEPSIYLSKDRINELLILLATLRKDYKEAIIFTMGKAIQSQKNPKKILILPQSGDSITYVFMDDFGSNFKKFFT